MFYPHTVYKHIYSIKSVGLPWRQAATCPCWRRSRAAAAVMVWAHLVSHDWNNRNGNFHCRNSGSPAPNCDEYTWRQLKVLFYLISFQSPSQFATHSFTQSHWWCTRSCPDLSFSSLGFGTLWVHDSSTSCAAATQVLRYFTYVN